MAFTTTINSLQRYCNDVGVIINKDIIDNYKISKPKLTNEDIVCALLIREARYLYNNTKEYSRISQICYLVSTIMGKINHKDRVLYRSLSVKMSILNIVNSSELKCNISYVTKRNSCNNCSHLDGVQFNAIDELTNPNIPIVPCNSRFGLCTATAIFKIIKMNGKPCRWNKFEKPDIEKLKLKFL